MESRAEDKSFKVSNCRVIATSLSRSDKPACGRVGCYTVDYGKRLAGRSMERSTAAGWGEEGNRGGQCIFDTSRVVLTHGLAGRCDREGGTRLLSAPPESACACVRAAQLRAGVHLPALAAQPAAAVLRHGPGA